eukprot:INCI14108.1.p1 GENE.INCI14108.1~~INCI14108.1.p1  ORF type:complete len:964 (-),score=165.88 INCI14108.1:1246-4116(-)
MATRATVVHVFPSSTARRRGVVAADSIAHALSFPHVEEILLHAGTFHELPLSINTPRKLTLRPSPGSVVTLTAQNPQAEVFLDIASSNVKISGLTLQFPKSSDGLRILEGVENVEVSKCIFHAGGVRCERSSVSFHDNELQQAGGVVFVDSSGTVSANVFSGCTENALTIDECTDISVLGNTFVDGLSHAICAIDSGHLTVSANRISGHRTAIFFNGCRDSKLNDNHIFDCAENGICLCDVDSNGSSRMYQRRKGGPDPTRRTNAASSDEDDDSSDKFIPEEAVRVLRNFVHRVQGCGIEVDALPPMKTRARDRRRYLLVAENCIFDCFGIGIFISGAVNGGVFTRNTVCGNQHALGNIVVCGVERIAFQEGEGGGDEPMFLMQDRLQGQDAPKITRNMVYGRTPDKVYQDAGTVRPSTPEFPSSANAKKKGARKSKATMVSDAPTRLPDATVGISLVHGARATLRRNTVEGHSIDGIRVFSNARGTVVRMNQVHRNSLAGIHFVLNIRSLLAGELETFNGCCIEENTLSYNLGSGMKVSLVTRDESNHHHIRIGGPLGFGTSNFLLLRFADNEVCHNQQVGLFVDVDAEDMTRNIYSKEVRGVMDFTANKIHENGESGIFFKGSLVGELGMVAGDDVEAPSTSGQATVGAGAGAELLGLQATQALQFKVESNDIFDEPGHGIVVRNCGRDLFITKNAIRNSGCTGLLALPLSNCTVAHNVLDNSCEFGILCCGEMRTKVSENNVKGNGVAGIGLAMQANPKIEKNEIHHNTDGIQVFDKGAGEISQNIIHDNTGIGITIRTAGNPVIVENAITDCQLGAIVCFCGAAGKVLKNSFKLNSKPAEESWYHYGLRHPPNWVVVCDALPAGGSSSSDSGAKSKAAKTKLNYSTTDVQYNSGSAPVILSGIDLEDPYFSSDDGDDDGEGLSDNENNDITSPHSPVEARQVLRKYLSTTAR